MQYLEKKPFCFSWWMLLCEEKKCNADAFSLVVKNNKKI